LQCSVILPGNPKSHMHCEADICEQASFLKETYAKQHFATPQPINSRITNHTIPLSY